VTASPHKRKADLLARAAESQRRNGKLPDTNADDKLWTGLLQQFDRQAAEPKPRAALDRNPARSAEAHLARDGAELLDGRAALREVKRLTPKRGARTPEAKLACRRLELLKLFPEWNERVIAALNEGARQAVLRGVKDMRLLIWLEVRKVLDASDAAFGKWERLPEPKKVSVSG
jgi:hypothetical protein